MSTATDARVRVLELRPEFVLGPVRGVWRPRPVLVVLLLTTAAFVAACLSVTTGSFGISLPDVLSAVCGRASQQQQFIVTGLRMPRAVSGLLAGAALGLSGALVQTVARNPLASPDLLGVTSGSSAAAVFIITGGGGIVAAHTTGVPLAAGALVGGLITGLLVYCIARRGGLDGYRLVLIGVAVTAVMQALTEWMLLHVQLEVLGGARAWLFGDLGDSGWGELFPLLVGLALLTVVALAVSRPVNILHLHDDHVTSLGLHLSAVRSVMLVVAVLLVGLSTAVCGPIPFVAFVSPQIALRLVRLPAPPLLASALTGAVLVVLADWVARVVLPQDLPVGLLTSLIGAPFMVLMLLRQAQKVSA